MQKTSVVLAVLFILGGCALSPERASQMSMYELCEKMLTSNNSKTREVAFTALEKNGDLEKCRANADNIKQAHYASDAAMSRLSDTMMSMSAAQNQQTQRQPQTFCNTSQQGQFANTHCWQQ